jgi:hypothetical protein
MSLQEPLLRVTGQDRKQTISSGAGATALPPIAFPPIIVWPGWGRILFVVILGTFISLCLTVWAEAVHDLTGLTTDQLLEFGSIPFVSTIFTYFHIWYACMDLWMFVCMYLFMHLCMGFIYMLGFMRATYQFFLDVSLIMRTYMNKRM